MKTSLEAPKNRFSSRKMRKIYKKQFLKYYNQRVTSAENYAR